MENISLSDIWFKQYSCIRPWAKSPTHVRACVFKLQKLMAWYQHQAITQTFCIDRERQATRRFASLDEELGSCQYLGDTLTSVGDVGWISPERFYRGISRWLISRMVPRYLSNRSISRKHHNWPSSESLYLFPYLSHSLTIGRDKGTSGLTAAWHLADLWDWNFMALWWASRRLLVFSNSPYFGCWGLKYPSD